MNSRYGEYDAYLIQHIGNVKRAWKEMLKPALVDNTSKQEIREIDHLIQNHDWSKTSSEEYEPYLNYFYPDDNNDSDEIKFNQAWLHHIHNNPHHWQYWVLILDDLDSKDRHKFIPQDMDFPSIAEMLCDWHSFSGVDPNSTAYNFYNKMKNRMMLSDNTRNTVEELIEYLRDPLLPSEE